MDVAWKIMRVAYKVERSFENSIFDLYKTYVGYKKVKGNKEILESNRMYKDRYTGQRCFIIGNGPSLKSVDLSLLRDEYTFTVNQSPKNAQFSSLNTNFHIWSDARFFQIDENDVGDRELLETMKNVNCGQKKPCVFYEISAMDMIKKYQLDKVLDIHYFAAVQFTKSRYLKHDKIDFTKVVCNWPTVVQIAITAAVYMGFTEIYLLGADSTGFINIAEAKMKDYSNGIKYAFDMNDSDIKRMEKTNSIYSIEQELKNQAEIFDDYALIAKYARKKGIKILNATSGGLLEHFDRVNYLEVICNNG